MSLPVRVNSLVETREITYGNDFPVRRPGHRTDARFLRIVASFYRWRASQKMSSPRRRFLRWIALTADSGGIFPIRGKGDSPKSQRNIRG